MKDELLRPRWLLVLLFVGVPAAGGVVKWHHNRDLLASVIAFAGFWALVLAFLERAGRKDSNPDRRSHGFADVIIGADGRMSTSMTVVCVWTFVFASALVIMASMVVFGHLQPEQAFHTGSSWDSYLLLLGGPFAAAVIAKGVVSYQTQQDPAAKSGTPAVSGTANTMSVSVGTQPSLTDIVNGDSGAPSLVDTQYSVFSLIAVLYFAGLFIANLGKYAAGAVSAGRAEWLPQIPSALLGLTSLAALTYVGNKALQTQGLHAVSFSPNPADAGGNVVATLVDLPETAAQATTKILVRDAAGGIQVIHPTAVNTAKKTVTFPAPSSGGAYSVAIAEPDTFTGAVTLDVTPGQ